MSDEASPTQTENRQSRQQRTGVAHHAGNADSQWLAVTSFPDYCRVGDKVIGFDTTATLDNPVTYSPNVIAAGHKVYRVGDLCRGTLGNDGEGLESGTSQGSGHVLITSGQDNVKVNGQPMARHGSECMINCDANGVGGAKGYLYTSTGNVSSNAAASNAPPTKAELLQQQAEEHLEQAKELRETLNDNPNGKTLEDAQALKGQVEALAEATQRQEQAVIDAYRNGDLTDDELLEVMANTDEAANRANDLRAEAERQVLKGNAGSNIKAAGKFALETFTPWGTVVDIKDTAALYGQGRYIAGTGMAILTAISLFPPARWVRGADAVGDIARGTDRAGDAKQADVPLSEHEEGVYISRDSSTSASEGGIDLDAFDFGAHLRSVAGPPPAGMPDPHAHHILFKRGNGLSQKALVTEGQALLRRYEIDPILGYENLTWAPNRIKGQHDINALKQVVDNLKMTDEMFGTREEMVKTLEALGRTAAERR